jgi:hypothetical protein
MATRCHHCNGSGQVDVVDGRITYGGSPDGFSVPCPSCRGTGYQGVQAGTTTSVAAEGGCVGRIVGWIVGWIFLGVLVFLAFAALVFVPRLFTSHGGNVDDGLVAAETGMGFAANHKIGDCHPRGSLTPAPCSGPHDSEMYAFAYVNAAPGSPYPGLSALRRFATNRCEPQFAAYAVGTPKDLGVYLAEAVPNAAEWAAGVRQIACGAIAARGTTLSGPLPRR